MNDVDHLAQRVDSLAERIDALERRARIRATFEQGRNEADYTGELFKTIAQQVGRLRADFAAQLDTLRDLRQRLIVEDSSLSHQYGDIRGELGHNLDRDGRVCEHEHIPWNEAERIGVVATALARLTDAKG